MQKQQEILDFWFGELFADGICQKEKKDKWWKKNQEFDELIKNKFGDEVIKAIEGEYTDWENTPEDMLALIILLDQFTRNIYRGKKEMYAGDKRAQELAFKAIAQGFDRELSLAKRQFIYMPLMHAEDKDTQKQCVRLFRSLKDEVVEHLKETVTFNLGYAERHLAIIQQFGRFPHRNKILGRNSTPEEIIFLQQPDSSF